MENLNEKNQNTTPLTELREWETPQLFTEDMATITEASNFPVSKGEDGFYQS